MERETIVVKYGSSSVVAGQGSAEENAVNNIDWFTDQLAEKHQEQNLIVVTSGAVALGKAMFPEIRSNNPHDTDQLLAMSGNPFLMAAWIQAFRKRGIPAGELLLTHREIEDDRTPDSPGSELERVFWVNSRLRMVPIVNENDALSRRELAELQYGGDNDGLAAHIALSVGASTLYLMTESNGVIDGRSQRRKAVASNQRAWDSVKTLTNGASVYGRGGMKSKIDAAIQVSARGINAYIAPASKSFASVDKGSFGTRFEPAHTEGKLVAGKA